MQTVEPPKEYHAASFVFKMRENIIDLTVHFRPFTLRNLPLVVSNKNVSKRLAANKDCCVSYTESDFGVLSRCQSKNHVKLCIFMFWSLCCANRSRTSLVSPCLSTRTPHLLCIRSSSPYTHTRLHASTRTSGVFLLLVPVRCRLHTLFLYIILSLLKKGMKLV